MKSNDVPWDGYRCHTRTEPTLDYHQEHELYQILHITAAVCNLAQHKMVVLYAFQNDIPE